MDATFLKFFIDSPIYSIPEEVNEINSVEELQEEALNYIGENKKKVAVLIETTEESFLESTEGILLLKICEAVSLHLEDIALVNVKENQNFTSLLSQSIDYEKLISFGCFWEIADVSPQNPYYKAVEVNGKTILISENLTHLASNQEAKKALWIALKQLFY